MRFFVLVMILFTQNVFGQMILNDPSIVSQERRMVWEGWGEWNPKGKYVLGIQTNFAYSTVWGNLAPSRNRRYKNGADIRPLKGEGGLEWGTYGMVSLMENETENMLAETKEWLETHEAELLNVINLGVYLDPLYLIYYEPNLRGLKNFKANSTFYGDWGFKTQADFINAEKYGLVQIYKELVLELQDKYNIAKKINVGRGKRLILFHEVFIEWRDLKNRIFQMDKHFFNNSQLNIYSKQKGKVDISEGYRTDEEIFNDIINSSDI